MRIPRAGFVALLAFVVLAALVLDVSKYASWLTPPGKLRPAERTLETSARLQVQLEEDVARLVESWSSRRVESPELRALVTQLGIADVQVVVLRDSPFGRGTSLPGLIVLDATLLEAPRAALAFVLAHEHGHLAARHWKRVADRAAHLAQAAGLDDATPMLRVVNRATPTETVHAEELEADRLARELLERRGLWSASEVRRFFEEALWSDGSATHPATVIRLQALGIAP